MSNPKKIIILTSEPKGWITEKFTEEAEKQNAVIEVINPNNCYIAVTKEPYLSFDGTKFLGADVCIPRLSEYNLEYKTSIIDNLAKMGMYVINSVDGLKLAQDKLASQIRINSLDIKTPLAAALTKDDQLEFAMEACGGKFPMIIKTLSGTHGIGVILADSKSSLISIAQTLLKEKVEFLLQEFIKHESSKRIITLGNGILASNIRHAKKDDFRTNAHQGSETEAFEPSESEIQMAIRIAENFKLDFCAIDYLDQDGEIIVFEVNGSPGLENIQTNYPDKNLCAEVIKYCLTRISQPSQPKEEPSNEQPTPEPNPELPVQSVEVSIEPDSGESEAEKAIDNAIGTTTEVVIKRINGDKPLNGKIDTGAGLCSLSGADVDIDEATKTIKFTLGESRYTASIDRFVKILNSLGESRRPVVKFDISINGHDFANVDFTIADRGHLTYSILIGRKFLEANSFKVNLAPSTPTPEIEEE